MGRGIWSFIRRLSKLFAISSSLFLNHTVKGLVVILFGLDREKKPVKPAGLQLAIQIFLETLQIGEISGFA